MLAGLLSPTLMKMLSDRGAEEAELETRLSRTAAAEPIAQIFPHPELLQKFREKICALRDTLNDELIRTEAAELMDRLIESVTIYPEGEWAGGRGSRKGRGSCGICLKRQRRPGEVLGRCL